MVNDDPALSPFGILAAVCDDEDMDEVVEDYKKCGRLERIEEDET